VARRYLIFTNLIQISAWLTSLQTTMDSWLVASSPVPSGQMTHVNEAWSRVYYNRHSRFSPRLWLLLFLFSLKISLSGAFTKSQSTPTYSLVHLEYLGSKKTGGYVACVTPGPARDSHGVTYFNKWGYWPPSYLLIAIIYSRACCIPTIDP
jgi:hypothetical protein